MRHEKVCLKMAANAKKRGTFDPANQRLDAEGLEGALAQHKREQRRAVDALEDPHTPAADSKKSAWRAKHESFVSAIREARKVQNVRIP